MRTLAELTADIRQTNIEKGWRGPGIHNTVGDYVALLESELGEALDAWRSWGIEDATGKSTTVYDTDTEWRTVLAEALAKPEGVGSELADATIRLLDMADVFGWRLCWVSEETLSNVGSALHGIRRMPKIETFGDAVAMLARYADRLWDATDPQTASRTMLRALLWTARKYGLDLNTEVERKIAYNRTRPFQHGGKAL